MTFYQELQLNQAGSKALIRNIKDPKEKWKHICIYLFKILLTVAFCVVFVTIYTKVFGEENSIVGVVVLLAVMVFRNADLGIKNSHGVLLLAIIYGILAFGPRISNMVGPFPAFLINVVCIGALMSLGCHNVIMSNHSTFVLGYLLLQGYDTTGNSYLLRLAGLLSELWQPALSSGETTRKSITNVRSDIFSKNLTFTLCVHGGRSA